jgi:hypothetical protein
MTDNQDIRDWAIAQGISVNLKGPVRQAVRDKWAARDGEPAPGGVPDPPRHGTPDTGVSEPAPASGKRSWWKGGKTAGPIERKPSGPRVSLEPMVTTAWGLAAKAMEARMLPVARVLQMQAPVAGLVIDDTARNTVVDQVLQPIARAGEKGERMFALVGPPILVAAICNKPEMYPVVRPILKTSVMLWMEVAEPAMKKAEKRAKAFEEKFGGVDIDAMIDALFQPPEGYVQMPDGSWAPMPEPAAKAA